METVEKKKVKCLVWDLDNTLWEGTLLEDNEVILRSEMLNIIRELDRRGILQSISSKNDHEKAWEKLKELGIDKYFLYPQINWNTKSSSIEKIATLLNIGIDTLAFIDDQQFELDEVNYLFPDLLCINADEIGTLLQLEEMIPRFITEDSRNRRLLYKQDQERNVAEQNFEGTQEDFLAKLGMTFTISHASKVDLQRAEELTVRTNQLNSTGYTYSYEELEHFITSEDHILLIASLEDCYGNYGKIGLALLECAQGIWTLKLLLMSCRVMSRGVGAVLIQHIKTMAVKHNVQLLAEFAENKVNRMMYISYKFAGFKEVNRKDNLILFESDTIVHDYPSYINVVVEK